MPATLISLLIATTGALLIHGCAQPHNDDQADDHSPRPAIYGFDITPSAHVRVASNSSGTIRVELTDGPVIVLKSPDGIQRPTECTISNDGSLIASGHVDGSVIVWRQTADGYAPRLLGKHKSLIKSCILSYDGQALWVADRLGAIRKWDVTSGTSVELCRQPNYLEAMDVSSDERLLVSTGAGTVLWDAQTGRKLCTLLPLTDRTTTVAFAPNGNRIAIGAESSGIRVLSINANQLTEEPGVAWTQPSQRRIQQMRFSPDGRFVAASIYPLGQIEVRHAADGRLVETIDVHRGTVAELRFVSSGDLYSASHDGHIRSSELPYDKAAESQEMQHSNHRSVRYSTGRIP